MSLFCHGELMRSSLGVLSVVARWNRARYKRCKRDGNLNKSTFLSFGVLWFVLGSSLVFDTRAIGKVQRGGILIFVLFSGRPIGYCLVFRGMKFLAHLHRQKKRFNNFLIFSSHLYNNIAVLLHRI